MGFENLENLLNGEIVGKNTFKENIQSTIKLSTLNIVDGRNNRLELACKTLKDNDVDIAVLTETKLEEKHTYTSYGYNISATKCTKINQGGVAIAVRNYKYWHLKGIKYFGSNVIKATLVYGNKRVVIIGIYITPSEKNMDTVKYLDKALHNVDMTKCIVLRNLNISFEERKDCRNENIVNAILGYGLIDLTTKMDKTGPYQKNMHGKRERREHYRREYAITY